MSSAFISYAHEDQEFMLALVGALQQHEHEIRYDQIALRVGDSIIERLAREIADGDFLIAIVSPDSVVSGWCQRELALAAADGINEKRVKVLPVRFRAADMPATLRDTLWADADRDNVETIAMKLADAMAAHLEGRPDDVAQTGDGVETAVGMPPPHAERAGDVDVGHLDHLAERVWPIFDAWGDVEAGQGNIRDLGPHQRRLRWAFVRLPDRVQRALPLVSLLGVSEWNEFFGGADLRETERGVSDELLSARTRVAQGLPVTGRWRIVDGGEGRAVGGRDAMSYAWLIERDDEARPIAVMISGTALAVSDAGLPDEVAEAKRTNGRSAVEKLIGMDDPPPTVVVSTAGIGFTLPAE